MAGYIPQTTFTGSSSNLESKGAAGIDQLNADNEEKIKMFDPTLIHEDGTPGGIHKDNLMTGGGGSGIITEDNIGSQSVAIATNAANATNATNSTNSTNATNVTTTINGHAITDIFETNGITVKNATTVNNKSANDSASNIPVYDSSRRVYDSNRLQGLSRVLLIDSSYAVSANSNTSVTLRNGGQHNFYDISVYSALDAAWANDKLGYVSWRKFQGRDSAHADTIVLYNDSPSPCTCVVKVYVWE